MSPDSTREGRAVSRPATAGSPGTSEPLEGLDRLLVRLLNLAAQPFSLVDLQGRFVHVNRAFESLVGYSADELRTRRVQDLTPERCQGLGEPHLARLHDLGITQRYETVYQHRDGREIPVEIVVDLYRDESGRPLGFYAFLNEIGERKRAEDSLRANEERLRLLYDEAPVGYHSIDTEGRILDVNRTECDMLGYTREEMIGRTIFDFVDDSARDEARAAVAERVRGENPTAPVERTYRTKDGRAIDVLIENRLVRDASGQVVAIRSTVQNVTRRKQAEAAQIASERRARALFEGIEDAVFVHDLQGHILDANLAASRRLGYTREEFLKLTTQDIDDPTFSSGFDDRLTRQLQQGQLRVEGRHRTKAGRLIPVDINTSAIQLEDQTVILAVIRDITERKALEETRRQFAEAQLRNAREIEQKNRALVDSEARYRQLTEGSLDAIVVIDRQGRVTLFNPAAERAFGYTAEEIHCLPCEELFAPADREPLLVTLRSFSAAHDTHGPNPTTDDIEGAAPKPCSSLVGCTVELRGRRKNGEEFPLELALSAAEVAGRLQFIGSIRDQTERQRMRTILMQSERLASIGLLSAGVAHEINNPLAFIANNLAVLERDLGGVQELIGVYESARDVLAEHVPETLKQIEAVEEDLDWAYVRENLARMIGRTRDGVQRVANIVQNLRGLARTTPPKLEPVLLADVISSALEMVRGRLRRSHIDLQMEQGASETILCVPSQIGQVVLNLVVNAIQAIESTDHVESGVIAIRTAEQPGWTVIEVQDNGCGIPAEATPHLFDPFFTTKPVGEGTGLGLSISHGIITGHGGRIEVESTVGEGTTFRVVLPRPDESADHADTARVFSEITNPRKDA